MILTEDQVLNIVKEHSEKPLPWVIEARKTNRMLAALVNGDDFHEVLLEKIEHIESQNKAQARKKYSKDIRDLFTRVMSKRSNVFDANGGSEQFLIKNESVKDNFNKVISNFKSNKSLFKYLSENFFNLADTDPNGCIVLEYSNKKPYPTYKSINDIRFYQSNGQLVDFILFEPRISDKIDYKEWRIIDDVNDYLVAQVGESFTILKGKSFAHPFGIAPVLILSEKEMFSCKDFFKKC